jgi:hypothetical protein
MTHKIKVVHFPPRPKNPLFKEGSFEVYFDNRYVPMSHQAYDGSVEGSRSEHEAKERAFNMMSAIVNALRMARDTADIEMDDAVTDAVWTGQYWESVA